ncbi:helix-turn-helix domain-containing protein [Streptomyces sp. INA 01156]
MTTNADEPQPRPRRRAPAGAAVLREDVTEAIRAAVFEELAAVGYARMSIEGIARRAGVGKTAVYRRWRSKLHLVLDLVSAIAVQGLPAPDTGSLEGDLRLLYEVTSRALRHPVASQILPTSRPRPPATPTSPRHSGRRCGRARTGRPGRRHGGAGAGRGPPGVDHALALDLISGPLLALGGHPQPETPEGLPARPGPRHDGGPQGAVSGRGHACGWRRSQPCQAEVIMSSTVWRAFQPSSVAARSAEATTLAGSPGRRGRPWAAGRGR